MPCSSCDRKTSLKPAKSSVIQLANAPGRRYSRPMQSWRCNQVKSTGAEKFLRNKLICFSKTQMLGSCMRSSRRRWESSKEQGRYFRWRLDLSGKLQQQKRAAIKRLCKSRLICLKKYGLPIQTQKSKTAKSDKPGVFTRHFQKEQNMQKSGQVSRNLSKNKLRT